MVQQLRLKYPLSLLLEIAQLPRATFYYHLKRMQKADKYAEAKAEISFIYQENKGRYGYRRITAVLHNKGMHLNHKTVRRLMKELGLVCRVRAKKYRSYKGDVGKIAPNLLNRDFQAEKPNQKWVTDALNVIDVQKYDEAVHEFQRIVKVLNRAVLEPEGQNK